MLSGLKTLETAVNRYLALDPETISRVAELSDKVVAINIRDWRLNFIILSGEKGFIFSDDHTLLPDVTLRGDLLDLIKVGVAQGSNQSLFSNNIEMLGDTETGEKVREILRNIDIDWEEHVSHTVGDSAAHQLFRGLHKIKSIGKNLITNICENLTEYLQIESSLLPSEQQVEKFFHELGVLRNDVERLEARIHRLEKRKNKS
jgi:ubiquinone biosynthesis protein UbiJ